jgi:hypothetical protein
MLVLFGFVSSRKAGEVRGAKYGSSCPGAGARQPGLQPFAYSIILAHNDSHYCCAAALAGM